MDFEIIMENYFIPTSLSKFRIHERTKLYIQLRHTRKYLISSIWYMN